jgi:hypothetical protein
MGGHANPTLEMRKVLIVMAEDETRELIVVEGEFDLGRFSEPFTGPDFGAGEAIQTVLRFQRGLLAGCFMEFARS